MANRVLMSGASAITINPSGVLLAANNLSDLTDKVAARGSLGLGLGSAALYDAPIAGLNATIAQLVRGDDTRILASHAAVTINTTANGLSIDTNQILTLSTTADVTFDSLKLNDLTASRLVSVNSSGILESIDLHDWVSGTTNQVGVTDNSNGKITLTTPQDIHTAATPTFAGLTLSNLTGILKGNGASAITAVTGTAGQLPYWDTSGQTLGSATQLYWNNTTNAFRLGSLSTEFISGFTGSGWQIKYENGVVSGGKTSGYGWSAEFDNLVVRGSMRIYEMIVSQIRALNGSYLFGDSAKATVVIAETNGQRCIDEEITDHYRISIDTTDSKYIPFAIGDLIRAQRFRRAGSGAEVYQCNMRVVYVDGASGGYDDASGITFSARLESGSAPEKGFEFTRLGNISTVGRQNTIYLTASDTDNPYIDIIAGVSSFSAWNDYSKVKMRLGKLDGITGGTNSYGLYLNTGVSDNGIYMKADDTSTVFSLGSNSKLRTHLSADTGFYVDGTGKFRVGTSNNGTLLYWNGNTAPALDSGFAWDGSYYLLKTGFTEIKSHASDFLPFSNNVSSYNILKNRLIISEITNNPSTFGTFYSNEDYLMTEVINATNPTPVIGTTFHKVTYVENTQPNVNIGSAVTTWLNLSGLKTYVISFYMCQISGDPNTKVVLSLTSSSGAVESRTVYLQTSDGWQKFSFTSYLNVSSLTLTLTFSQTDEYNTSGTPTILGFNGLQVYSQSPLFELSSTGLLLARSMEQYISIDASDFSIKGASIDAKNVVVRGDITVYGTANIVGGVAQVPSGYDPTNWNAAYTHSTDVTGNVHGATTSNTASAIVRRDSSGNISIGELFTGSNNLYTVGSTINSFRDTNLDNYDLWLNYTGYNGGTTRFRNTIIGDGKQASIATFTGSSKVVAFAGALTWSGGSSTNANTAYSHTLLTNNPHSVTASQVGLGSVTNLSAVNYFNNMGDVHGANSNFNTVADFGFRYMNGTTNSPGITSATQYYMVDLGLGSQYPHYGTAGSYGMQLAVPRTPLGGLPYVSVRFNESNSWGAWSKIYAGYADSAGNADTVDNYHLDQSVLTTSRPTFTGISFSSTDPSAAEGVLRYKSGLNGYNTLEVYNNSGYWEVINTGLLRNEPTGFPNRTDTTFAFVNGTRTLSINSSVEGATFYIYSRGRRFAKTSASIQLSNNVGLHYVYYTTDGTLSEGLAPWSFIAGAVPIATVYWNGSEGIIGDERHGIIMDGAVHEWIHETVGARYASGLTGTFASGSLPSTAVSIGISSGAFHDEDIDHSITTQTTCRVMYRNGTTWLFTAAQSAYYYFPSSIIQYDNAGTVTAVDNQKYVAYWVFVTNNPTNPIISMMGQRQDINLADARSNNLYESLSFGTIPLAEMKLLYRVILQRNGTSTPVVADISDMRSISNLSSGTYVASAHGVLTGLTLDDHPQYLLLAGRGGQTIADAITFTSAPVMSALTASRFVVTDGSKNLASFDLFATANTWTANQTFNSTITVANGTSTTISTRKGANSDGDNIWIGGGGTSAVGEVGATYKGSRNVSLGYNSLYYNSTGYANTALGYASLYYNSTGNLNTAIGHYSGRYIADGVTNNASGNNSVFLGYDTKANADGETNQIVIGYGAVGYGSNSATLGSSSITKTILRGNVGIGTTSPNAKLNVDGNAIITGSLTTSGAINGQTISSAANFTGNANIGGYLRVAGAVANNIYDGAIPVNNSSQHVQLSSPTIGELALVNSMATDNKAFDYPDAIEYTTDGTNWVAHPTALSDGTVKDMFIGRRTGNAFILGKSPSNGNWTATRFHWTAITYVHLRHIYLYCNSQGHDFTIKVEKSQDNVNWTTVGTSNAGGGWPGHHFFTHSDIWHNTAGNDKYLRVTFTFTWSGTYPSNNILLDRFGWYGNYPANSEDQIWYWDRDKQIFTRGNMWINGTAWGSSVGAWTGNFYIGNKATTTGVVWGTRNTSGAEAVLDLSNIGTITTSGDINTTGGTFKLNGTSIFATANTWTANQIFGTVGTTSKISIGTRQMLSTYSWGGSNTNNWMGGATNTTVTGTLSYEGNYNNAIGVNALSSNTTGYYNTAIGVSSLRYNSSGYFNVAVGVNALQNNLNGAENCAIGIDALFSNTTGGYNLAVGNSVLYNNITGRDNTAIGVYALYYSLVSYNTAIGRNAGFDGYGGDTSSNNRIINDDKMTLLGQSACKNSASTLTNSTAVGFRAMVTASNQVMLGNTDVTEVKTSGVITSTGTGNSSFAGNVLIGTTTDDGTGAKLQVDGDINLASGHVLKLNGTSIFATANTWTANQTFNSTITVADGTSTTISTRKGANSDGYNIWIGTAASNSIGEAGTTTKGSRNLSLGMDALGSVTTAYYNVGIGGNTLGQTTTGWGNASVGYQSMYLNNTGFRNTAVGKYALYGNTSGSYNTAVGVSALSVVGTGVNNVGVGAYALYDLAITDGSGNNIGIGYNTGRGITTGINNTIIGSNVTGLSASLSNNIILADGSGNKRLQFDNAGAATFASSGTFGGQITNTVANAKSTTGYWHTNIVDNTPLAANIGGGITFTGRKTDVPAYGIFGAIDGYKINATSGNEAGGVRLWYSNGTNLVEGLNINNYGNATFAGTLTVQGTGLSTFGGAIRSYGVKYYYFTDFPLIFGNISHEGNGDGLKILTQYSGGNTASGNINFYTGADGATAKRMTIGYGGGVTIANELTVQGTGTSSIAGSLGVGHINSGAGITPISPFEVTGVNADPSTTGTPNGIFTIGDRQNTTLIGQMGICNSVNGWWLQARSTYNTSTFALLLNPVGGNVGIGTSSPGTVLDVYSNSAYTAFFRCNGDFIVGMKGSTNGGTSLFSIRNNATGVVHLNTQNSARLALGVSTGTDVGTIVETVTITSTGRVAINNTSPTRAIFEVNNALGNTVAKFGNSSADNVFIIQNSPIIAANAYYNSGWYYDGTGEACFIGMDNGAFDFSVAPSGSAGASATFTRVLALTAGGDAWFHTGASNQLYVTYGGNSSANYAGSLNWSTLQLGNNGTNRIVAGHYSAGGLFEFWVNNTNRVAYNATPNGTLALTLSAAGNAAFAGTGTHTFGGTITSTSFASGFGGSGWRVSTDMETTNLSVRGRMSVYELLIQQIRATNGAVIVSSTGKVATATNNSGTWTITTDTNTNHGFAVGDIIRAKRWTGSGTYDSWMQVASVPGTTSFTATVLSSSDSPAVGYEYVRMGSVTDSTRRGLIYMTADDTNAPYIDIKDEVSSVALFNDFSTTKVRLGKLSGITSPTMGVLSGYGLYTQNAYLEGNANIVGNLSVGDGRFYAGLLKKNLLRVSEKFNDNWETYHSGWDYNVPWHVNGGAKSFISVDGFSNVLHIIGSSEYWQYLFQQVAVLPDTTYTLSFYASSNVTSFNYGIMNNADSYVYTALGWINEALDGANRPSITGVSSTLKRHSVTFTTKSNATTLNLFLYEMYGWTSSNWVNITQAQLEVASAPTPYQRTDSTLSSDTGYGMWSIAGGFGGTMQNPVVSASSAGLRVVDNSQTATAVSAAGTYIGKYSVSGYQAVLINSAGITGYTGTSTNTNFSLPTSGTAKIASARFSDTDLWTGNDTLANAGTTFVLGDLGGTPKLALGSTADSISMMVGTGFYTDGSGNFRVGATSGGVITSGISWDGTTFKVRSNSVDVMTAMASAATIAGWNFTSDYLYKGSSQNGTSSNIFKVWLASATSSSTAMYLDGGYARGFGYTVHKSGSYYAIGQFGALVADCTATSENGFIGIQQVEGSGAGVHIHFRLSTNPTSGVFDNQIAGWIFDSSKIYNANISISSATLAAASGGIVLSGGNAKVYVGSAITLDGATTGKVLIGSATDIDTGAGVFMDGGGNFRTGTATSGSEFIKFASSTLTIKSSAFTLSGSTTLYISTSLIALGTSASSMTVAGTSVGTVMDNAGGFLSYGDANNYLRRSGTSLDIKSQTFTLIAGTAGAGQIGLNTSRFALGATLPTSASAGTGIWMDATGLYGLNANTVNFKLDATNGNITAIAGYLGGSTNGWQISAGLITALGSGTIQTSSVVNTGVKINSTAISGYNGTVQTLNIGTDGSGWVGVTGTRAIEWTTAGVVTIADWTINASTITGGNVTLNSAGSIKVGTLADATTTATTNSGFFADNSGNILVKGNTSGTNYVKVTGAGSIDINATVFNLSAGSLTISGNSTSSYIKLGATTGVTDTTNAGTWIDNSGNLMSFGNASNYIQRNGTSLTIKSQTFTLASGKTSNSDTTNAGLWMSANDFYIGAASDGNYVKFVSGALSLKSDTFTLQASTAGSIGLTATAYALGNGVWLSSTATTRFRVGNAGASRMQWDDTNFEIYNSSNVKTISFGATNTIAGWTISDTTISKGTGSSGGFSTYWNSATSTAGNYYYNWGAKLQGLALTWFNSSNAGHLIFGEMASGVGTVKTGYYGIQMMDHNGYEYFALGALTTGTTLTPYNRIAGWTFNDSKFSSSLNEVELASTNGGAFNVSNSFYVGYDNNNIVDRVSEGFNDGGWSNDGQHVISTTSMTDPWGFTSTVTRMTRGSGTAYVDMHYDAAANTATTYTFSCWVKTSSGSITGGIGSYAGGYPGNTSYTFDTTWRRYTNTYTKAITDTTYQYVWADSIAPGTYIYVTGCQLEKHSYASPYRKVTINSQVIGDKFIGTIGGWNFDNYRIYSQFNWSGQSTYPAGISLSNGSGYINNHAQQAYNWGAIDAGLSIGGNSPTGAWIAHFGKVRTRDGSGLTDAATFGRFGIQFNQYNLNSSGHYKPIFEISTADGASAGTGLIAEIAGWNFDHTRLYNGTTIIASNYDVPAGDVAYFGRTTSNTSFLHLVKSTKIVSIGNDTTYPRIYIYDGSKYRAVLGDMNFNWNAAGYTYDGVGIKLFDSAGSLIFGNTSNTAFIIAGWNFDTTKFYNATGTLDGSAYTTTGMVLGSTGYIAAPKFRVTTAGVLYATEAQISGVITATSGTFAGTVNANAGTFTSTVTIGGATSGTLQVGTGTNKISLVGTNLDSTTYIQIGNGGYNTTTAKFYADGSGQFSLGQKLTWDGSSTLSINGTITSSSGSIGSWNLGSGWIYYVGGGWPGANNVTGGGVALKADSASGGLYVWSGTDLRTRVGVNSDNSGWGTAATVSSTPTIKIYDSNADSQSTLTPSPLATTDWATLSGSTLTFSILSSRFLKMVYTSGGSSVAVSPTTSGFTAGTMYLVKIPTYLTSSTMTTPYAEICDYNTSTGAYTVLATIPALSYSSQATITATSANIRVKIYLNGYNYGCFIDYIRFYAYVPVSYLSQNGLFLSSGGSNYIKLGSGICEIIGSGTISINSISAASLTGTIINTALLTMPSVVGSESVASYGTDVVIKAGDLYGGFTGSVAGNLYLVAGKETNAMATNGSVYIHSWSLGNTSGNIYLAWDGSTNADSKLGIRGAIHASYDVNITGTLNVTSTLNANAITVASTSVVTNLNADTLDGNHSSAFATSGHNHSGIYVPINGDVTGNAYIRFSDTHETGTNDGKIGARLYTAGLNIVGVQTDGTEGRNTYIFGALQVQGDVTWNASDLRLKNLVSVISNPLQKIKALTGWEFFWNEKYDGNREQKQYGLIAQDVEKIMPEAIKVRHDGYLTYRYEQVQTLLVEGIKSIIDITETHEEKIARLEKRVAELEAKYGCN